MRATTAVSVTAALLLVFPMLIGCNSDDSDGSDGSGGSGGSGGSVDSGGSGGSGEVSRTSWTFDRSDCLDQRYPLPLTVSTTVEQEAEYVQNVVACTSDEQYGPVWLHNVGHEVWTLDNEPELDFLENTEESYSFSVTFPSVTLLDPDDVLLVHAPPAQASWTLSPAYTVAWDTQSEAIEQVKSLGEAALVAAMKKQSEEHAALAGCVLAGFNAADAWAGNPDGFSENLGAALSTGAGATSCAAGWRSVWQKDFEATAGFLEKVDTRWRIFSTFGEHLLVFARP